MLLVRALFEAHCRVTYTIVRHAATRFETQCLCDNLQGDLNLLFAFADERVNTSMGTKRRSFLDCVPSIAGSYET